MISVSLLGYILIPLAIVLMFCPIKYLIMATIITSIFQAASVISVSGNSINPFLFFCMLLIFKDILNSLGRREHKLRIPYWIVSFLCLIIYNIIISAYMAPAFGNFSVVTNSYGYVRGISNIYTKLSIILEAATLANMISLFIYIGAVYSIYRNRAKLSELEFRNLIFSMLITVLVVGYVSMICLNLGIGVDLIKNTIYSDSESRSIEVINLLSRGTGFRFVSTFKEGSYCGGFLSSFVLALIITDLKKYKYIIIVIFSAILFNQTSTGFVLIGIGLALVFLFSKKRSLRTYILVIAICSVVVFFSLGYEDILANLIINKMTSSSGIQRNLKNSNCWDAFLYSYGIGIGLNNIRGSSLFFNLLGGVGVLGTTFFAIFIYRIFKGRYRSIIDFNNDRNRLFALVFSGFCLLGQILSQPDLFLNTFWMAMMLLALTDKKVEKSIYRASA